MDDGELVRLYGRYRWVMEVRRDGDRDRTVRIRATAGMMIGDDSIDCSLAVESEAESRKICQ